MEYNNQAGSGGRVRLRHYPTLTALLAGSHDREATPARTLSACNEGTPTIYSASLTPDIDHCVIDVGFHYQRDCDLDRQARGRLTNFTGWTAVADTALDAAITAAAAAQGQQVNGNIGDRDVVSSTTAATRCTRCSTARAISVPGGCTCTPGRPGRSVTCRSPRTAAAPRSPTPA